MPPASPAQHTGTALNAYRWTPEYTVPSHHELQIATADKMLLLRTPQADVTLRGHSPPGALWRAAVLPGWGQVYNRQIYKLPFVYGALGGMTYLTIFLNNEYLIYRRTNLFIVDPETYAHLDSTIPERLMPFVEQNRGDLIRAQRDLMRRNRDLSILGIGVAYVLSIADAYVSAHLIDFDVAEDLSIQLIPAESGVFLGVRLDF